MINIDLQAARGITPHQPTIYDYTDVRGALGVLKSDELWFTERAHLDVHMDSGFLVPVCMTTTLDNGETMPMMVEVCV